MTDNEKMMLTSELLSLLTQAESREWDAQQDQRALQRLAIEGQLDEIDYPGSMHDIGYEIGYARGLRAAVATVVDVLSIRNRDIDDATACERLLII